MKINFRRVLLLAGIASLFLSYAVLLTRVMLNPVEHYGADFAAFYAAGKIARNEGPSHIYDLSLQQKYQELMVGFDIPAEHIRPYIHPPFVVPLAQLVALDNYVLSFILWDLMMVAFAGLAAVPVMKLMSGLVDRPQKVPFLLSVLLFFPSFLALMYGQDNAIFFLGAGLWMLGVLSEDDRQAGLGLAVMAIRPHLALILAVPFLFHRRRVWWWFLGGILALALASLAYSGPEGVWGFLKIVLVSARGVNYSTGEDNMVSFIGIVLRIFPDANGTVVRLVDWGLYLVAIAGLCILWSRSRQIGEKELGLAVVLGLLTGPHVHIQDLILLIVPVIGAIRVFLQKRYLSGQDAAFVPLGISLAMLLSFSSELLLHNLPYLVMLLMMAALWFPQRVAFWSKEGAAT
jgi:hypothetical protein